MKNKFKELKKYLEDVEVHLIFSIDYEETNRSIYKNITYISAHIETGEEITPPIDVTKHHKEVNEMVLKSGFMEDLQGNLFKEFTIESALKFLEDFTKEA